MVRIRAAVPDDVTPGVDAAMVRGRGRRGAHAAARAPTREAVGEPPVVSVGGGDIPVALVTSQTRGGSQTPATHTPEQRVHVGQLLVRAATSEEGQLRFVRFKRYNPPTFNGLASESAQGFLEECHNILRTMDIVEMSGVALTTFQLKGATYQWWRANEMGSPSELASLTWVQFSKIFLREFVPQSRRDAWRVEFAQLRQGTISVSEYAVRFSDLARHAHALVATVRECVRRFIEGLMHDIRFSMARELDVLFQ
ncbi:uncharacterized protein [Nicotiana tomentosiformis]|uniref:uncharacterized protein n=1 Tax=Nicotiana tomentosiformis TaxID=4098 RepID=UPI00388CEC4C